MFGRQPQNGLKLRVGEARFEFASPEDFAFALAGRASVPGARLGTLIEMTDESLGNEVVAIRQLERTFNDALDTALRGATSIGAFLNGFDINLISEDHDWRAIIKALNASDESKESFTKVAVAQYVRYLAARRQAVAAIYTTRRAAQGDVPAYADDRMQETAIFDVTDLTESEAEVFMRIPKGETVEVDLSTGSSVELLLATRRCRVDLEGNPVFVDDLGHATPLRRGKSIVGRDPGCDVQINRAYREVSRQHLIVEIVDAALMRLTDISVHGTSLGPKHRVSTSL